MKVKNFSGKDRWCSLCRDEMSIKSNLFYNVGIDKIVGIVDNGTARSEFNAAHNASLLMIRGIFSKWSQPLTYVLSHSTCPSDLLEPLIIGAMKLD